MSGKTGGKSSYGKNSGVNGVATLYSRSDQILLSNEIQNVHCLITWNCCEFFVINLFQTSKYRTGLTETWIRMLEITVM